MWADLEGIGRRPGTGGYRRYAWTRTVTEESWTDRTVFDSALTARVAAVLGDPPRLATGAGHDAGILAAAGVPAAMLFVRNPTGVSHAPSERADCLAGVAALAAVAADVTGPEPSP